MFDDTENTEEVPEEYPEEVPAEETGEATTEDDGGRNTLLTCWPHSSKRWLTGGQTVSMLSNVGWRRR